MPVADAPGLIEARELTKRFGVFALWTAALLAACGWLLVRRDA